MSLRNFGVKPAKIRGTHLHSFRCGEWATIVGVVMLKPDGLPERACFVGMYPDGYVDYTSINGGDYEIETDGPREP